MKPDRLELFAQPPSVQETLELVFVMVAELSISPTMPQWTEVLCPLGQ